MPESLRELKSRIKSIQGTRQLTGAMELAAAGKLRGARERVRRSRPFFELLQSTLEDIQRGNRDFSSPYTRSSISKRACRIVIAGDRGPAGGYNSSLFRAVEAVEGDLILPIGRRAQELYRRLGFELMDGGGAAEELTLADCRHLGERLSQSFLRGDFGRLTVSYTAFVNVLTRTPTSLCLLPIEPAPVGKTGLINYDPSAGQVFDSIVPLYIGGVIYGALCEAIASELSARRVAMEAANRNADELLSSLHLRYNRARQASITRELTEIAAGGSLF